MATSFQQHIKESDLKAVTKLLHPDLPDGWEKRFKWYRKYSWVCVSFRLIHYGVIDFAINNHHQREFRLYGPSVTKNDIKVALENGGIDFNVWRFSLDKLYIKNSFNLPEEPCILEAESYIKSRYSLPSVDEFYTVYYED